MYWYQSDHGNIATASYLIVCLLEVPNASYILSKPFPAHSNSDSLFATQPLVL